MISCDVEILVLSLHFFWLADICH